MKGRIAYTQKEVFKRFIDEFDITGKKYWTLVES